MVRYFLTLLKCSKVSAIAELEDIQPATMHKKTAPDWSCFFRSIILIIQYVRHVG